MSKFDWSDLDARALKLLVALVEAGSVTGAAQTLGVTQSAVSHLLNKLRGIFDDPLFVKSGRGGLATARALALAEEARVLLKELERLAAPQNFDPAQWRGLFTIAANDFQRDALLPALAARLRQSAPQLCLRIIASNVPTLEMLRGEDCQLVISPRPPEGSDILQKRLFSDDYRIFYDKTCRRAPRDKAEYLDADHISVLYEPRRAIDLDIVLAERGFARRFAILVPGFAGLPAFLRGSGLIATAPGLLRFGLLREFAHAAPPFPCPKLPMYMIWSRSRQDDPAHKWLRDELQTAARPLVAQAD